MNDLIAHYRSQHQHPINKICHTIGVPIITLSLPLFFFRWRWALAFFVTGWVLQFIGHAIEGNRPAFFRSPVYFLVGPWWLGQRIVRSLGLLKSAPHKTSQRKSAAG